MFCYLQPLLMPYLTQLTRKGSLARPGSALVFGHAGSAVERRNKIADQEFLHTHDWIGGKRCGQTRQLGSRPLCSGAVSAPCGQLDAQM